MATPLARRPEPGDGSPQAAVTISAVTEYLLPATMRGVAAQAMAALGVLDRAVDRPVPSFLTLQHGGGNAAVANPIAGLAVAAVAAASLARSYAGLQFASVLLGVWVIISRSSWTPVLHRRPDVLVQHRSGGYLVAMALAPTWPPTWQVSRPSCSRAATAGSAPRARTLIPAGPAPRWNPAKNGPAQAGRDTRGAASRSRPQVGSLR